MDFDKKKIDVVSKNEIVYLYSVRNMQSYHKILQNELLSQIILEKYFILS